MKIIDLYRNGKEELKKVEKLKVSKKISTKTTLFTTLFTIIIGLPFITIFGSLITVFSPVRFMYWVTLGLICIMLSIILTFSPKSMVSNDVAPLNDCDAIFVIFDIVIVLILSIL